MVSESVTAIGKVYPCESLYDLIFSNPSLGSGAHSHNCHVTELAYQLMQRP